MYVKRRPWWTYSSKNVRIRSRFTLLIKYIMDDVPRFDNNVNDCQVWQTRCVSSSMKSLHIVECMETLLGVEEVLAFIKRNDFGLYDI